jgi:hypothetical protein
MRAANRIMLAPLVNATSIGDEPSALQNAAGNSLAQVEKVPSDSVVCT